MKKSETTLIQRIERGLTTVEDAETVRRLVDHFKRTLIGLCGWEISVGLVIDGWEIIEEIEDGG